MKRLYLIAIFIILILQLCGCQNAINEGEVYGKEYREESTTVITVPLTTYNGKTATTTLIPYFIHYPERYVILIKAFQDGEWVTEDFYVSKIIYDEIEIGDMFLYDRKRGDLKDEPYEKKRKEE